VDTSLVPAAADMMPCRPAYPVASHIPTVVSSDPAVDRALHLPDIVAESGYYQQVHASLEFLPSCPAGAEAAG
jgi:hypothetical protein